MLTFLLLFYCIVSFSMGYFTCISIFKDLDNGKHWTIFPKLIFVFVASFVSFLLLVETPKQVKDLTQQVNQLTRQVEWEREIRNGAKP